MGVWWRFIGVVVVYEVRVLVDDPQDVLRLGQPATVHLTTGTAQ